MYCAFVLVRPVCVKQSRQLYGKFFGNVIGNWSCKQACDVNGLVISRTREKHATAWKDKRPIFWQKYSTEFVGFFLLSFWNVLHCTHLHWPQNEYENKMHRFSVQSEFIILYPFSLHCSPVKCILLIVHESRVYNLTLWAICNYSCSHSY